MRNEKEDTILRSDAIEAVYRAYRRPSDDEVFIRMREELERVPGTSMATIQANVKVDMDELVKRVTEEIRNSFILDPVKSDRLLKESDVIEVVTQYLSCDYPTEEMAREDAEALIERIPSADRPLGEWIVHGEAPIYVKECSACGAKFFHHATEDLTPFCAMCGARMKGADDDL